MASYLETFLVLKLCRSKLVKFEHCQNILVISLTAAVLKLVTSKLVKDLQFTNIYDILVTLAVLK